MTKPVLLIHGGAGVVQRAKISDEKVQLYLSALEDIATQARQVLLDSNSAVEAVTEAVRLLEDNPLFNAGKGAVLTNAGTHELDASIMDGTDKSAGAVVAVQQLKNPVLAAKAVMQKSSHVCFTSQGAEDFAKVHGCEFVASDYFTTPERVKQLREAQSKNQILLDHDGENALSVEDNNPIREKDKFGTVGAVALDAKGRLAAATSTGGMTNKAVGRVGDTPMIGAGCYADDLCAVSCTGTGEMFMRGVIAYDVASRIRYGGETLTTASDNAIFQTLADIDGAGGLIAVDKAGNIALPMNTSGMYRAIARENEPVHSHIFTDND